MYTFKNRVDSGPSYRSHVWIYVDIPAWLIARRLEEVSTSPRPHAEITDLVYSANVTCSKIGSMQSVIRSVITYTYE